MKLFVARHGQTIYNIKGLCNSDPKLQINLTEIGKQQAEKLANKLKKVQIDQIYASELIRTEQTAEIVNKFHSAVITIDERLNDNKSGFENKHFSEYYSALDNANNKWTARFNDGESLEDVKQRVNEFLNEIKSKNHESALVVTSMIIVQAIYGILGHHSNQEAWDFSVDLASCIEFEI